MIILTIFDNTHVLVQEFYIVHSQQQISKMREEKIQAGHQPGRIG